MRIAVAREAGAGEARVAATPDTVKRMKGLGADVVVQAGAGTASGVPDADYEAAGATIAPTIQDTVRDADVVLKVRRPSERKSELQARSARSRHDGSVRQRGGAQAACRCRRRRHRHGADAAHQRAQVMDVLSSQANLAGYRAVVDAAAEYGPRCP